ncbi:MAG TPA: hypothetical protein VHM90_22330 [Phycisphaerae bacterium]|nr:hypothetical protein [Phycisphaerae bacterium]
MAAFIKSLSRLFGGSGKHEPAAHLAAFGKHPGWNDHLDDLGLDTDPLVTAKTLLYMQGISQNIDAGAWEALEPNEPNASRAAIARLDLFRHDFLWHLPANSHPALLAGRLWSSTDGKGRDKYPMVLCSQIAGMPDGFVADFVFPFLTRVHERCAEAATAADVRSVIAAQSESLRAHLHDPARPGTITGRQIAAVASHADMGDYPKGGGGGGGGFHRIVYQFVRGLSAFREPAKSHAVRRPEQLRLPACGMAVPQAMLFWYHFALMFVDSATPLLLIAPDQGSAAPWVDLIAGEPTAANIFCIKAGTKSLPFTSDIPYTLEPSFITAIDAYLGQCGGLPDDSPLPEWPLH